ncbi:hypothetical protein GCM10027020_04540 [Nocardioides salsibiostraticola]
MTAGIGATAPASAAAAEPVPGRPSGNVALAWAPLYMANDHEYTAAEARRLANRFDLVAAVPYGLKDHSAAMRRENNKLSLLAYSNATLAPQNIAGALPEEAFAHDSNGNRIKAIGWNTFQMEPDHPAWREAADNMCVTRNAVGNFDGCLVDMLTLGIFAKGYFTGNPVNPKTGVEYTQTEYRSALTALSADLRRRSPGLIQIGNIVENAYRYWENSVSSRPLAMSTPGAQMEDFLRGAQDGSKDWPSAAEWKSNVDIITDFENAGVTGLFTTKAWSGVSNALSNQWHGYSMASFLMGANGESFFAYTRSRDKAGASQTNVSYTMPDNLGMPRGAMSQTNGAWSRTFANGQSLVNPGNSSVRVPISGVKTKLDGSKVSGSVLLPPHTGEVLVNSSGSVTTPASTTPTPTATPAPTAAPFKLRIKHLGNRTRQLKPNRWRKMKVVVSNVGGQTSPRGKIKVKGRGLKSRPVRIRSLKPGARTKVRVKVKLVRRMGVRPAKMVYRAGGKRAITKVRVRARR